MFADFGWNSSHICMYVIALGGEDGFRELVNEAHRLGIQLCVGIPMSLSLRSMHRRYESLTVLSLDEYDRRVPQVGCSSIYFPPFPSCSLGLVFLRLCHLALL